VQWLGERSITSISVVRRSLTPNLLGTVTVGCALVQEGYGLAAGTDNNEWCQTTAPTRDGPGAQMSHVQCSHVFHKFENGLSWGRRTMPQTMPSEDRGDLPPPPLRPPLKSGPEYPHIFGGDYGGTAIPKVGRVSFIPSRCWRVNSESKGAFASISVGRCPRPSLSLMGM
jgi:hypothetical protein